MGRNFVCPIVLAIALSSFAIATPPRPRREASCLPIKIGLMAQNFAMREIPATSRPPFRGVMEDKSKGKRQKAKIRCGAAAHSFCLSIFAFPPAKAPEDKCLLI
jgi:hypothetical protein